MEAKTFILYFSITILAFAIGMNYAVDFGNKDNRITANESNINNHLAGHDDTKLTDAISELNSSVLALNTKNSEQDGKIAVLEAKTSQPKTTPVAPPKPKEVPSESLHLVLSSSDPSDIKFTFSRGDIVYIKGKSDESINSMVFEIISEGTNQVLSRNTFNTGSDGTFTKVYITDDQTLIGTYTAKFTWSFSQSDFIKFEII